MARSSGTFELSYGLRVYGLATGAHYAADIQLGYDKAINGLTAPFAGADFISGIDCLSHAMLSAYEQAGTG